MDSTGQADYLATEGDAVIANIFKLPLGKDQRSHVARITHDVKHMNVPLTMPDYWRKWTTVAGRIATVDAPREVRDKLYFSISVLYSSRAAEIAEQEGLL